MVNESEIKQDKTAAEELMETIEREKNEKEASKTWRWIWWRRWKAKVGINLDF